MFYQDKEIANKEILTVVKNVKNYKACGLDNINNENIKSTIDVLLPVYVNLLNSFQAKSLMISC